MRPLALLLPLAWSLAAHAADIPLIQEETRIPPGQTQRFEFGTVPQAGTTVLLTVSSRVDFPSTGGSNAFMTLTLNGRRVDAARSRTVQRLLNKPMVSPVTPTLTAPWFLAGIWRVLYAPDFEVAKAQTWYTGDPYTYVLDITDLTNPAAENRLEITNDAEPGMAARMKASLDLVLGTLLITTKPEPSPTMAPADAVVHRINRGEPGAGSAAYQVEVGPGGGFTVTIGNRRLPFSTAISYPNAGLNTLPATGAPAAGAQPAWQPKVARIQGGADVTAEGPDYRLARTIRFAGGKIDIADAITNKHADAPLGLLVRHTADLKGQEQVGVRLAGNGDPALNEYYSAANPTVHLGLGEVGVGLVCEDDVFRNQARLFYDAEATAAGLRTEMLRIGPGETYTLRWSIHPVASPEYYDFINLLRADWGANYTVEGAWMFFSPDQVLDMDQAELKARIERLGIRYACSWGGWVDPKADKKRIGFGAEVRSDYWADYRDRLKRATAKLHEASPAMKVLIYYDSQRDTSADAGERYPDSKLTDAQGNHLSTNWSNIYSLTWSMVATVDNSYGRAMLEVIDTYMDEIGADGLYWDEMENVGYGAPLVTYSIPDGHSCLLDLKTYTIDRELGITTLLGEGHRLAVIEKVRAKGGTVMGNAPTTTRALLDARVQRMVEIQHNDAWHYEGNLATPLGYASSQVEFDNVRRALGFATLLVGTRTDYAYDTSRFFYPITPIELHPGYLLGRERIITMHSGRYGWPGETVPATLRLFDAEGKLRETREVTAGEGDARVAVELGEGEVAVMERRR